MNTGIWAHFNILSITSFNSLGPRPQLQPKAVTPSPSRVLTIISGDVPVNVLLFSS